MVTSLYTSAWDTSLKALDAYIPLLTQYFDLDAPGGSSDSACLKQLVTFHAKASPPAAATQLAKSLGHSVTGLWPHQVSLCFSNTQAYSQLQVVPPEISSSWKAFLPALGVPGSSPYLLPNTRAISESPKPAPPPSASRPSWTHHCFYLLHGTTWVIWFVYFLTAWLLSQEKHSSFWKYYMCLSYFGPSPLSDCKFYESWNHIYIYIYVVNSSPPPAFWQVTVLAPNCWCLSRLYAWCSLKYNKERKKYKKLSSLTF